MFIASLFLIIENGKQPKYYSSIGEWINYWAIKKITIDELVHSMNLIHILFKEIFHKISIYSRIPLT